MNNFFCLSRLGIFSSSQINLSEENSRPMRSRKKRISSVAHSSPFCIAFPPHKAPIIRLGFQRVCPAAERGQRKTRTEERQRSRIPSACTQLSRTDRARVSINRRTPRRALRLVTGALRACPRDNWQNSRQVKLRIDIPAVCEKAAEFSRPVRTCRARSIIPRVR